MVISSVLERSYRCSLTRINQLFISVFRPVLPQEEPQGHTSQAHTVGTPRCVDVMKHHAAALSFAALWQTQSIHKEWQWEQHEMGSKDNHAATRPALTNPAPLGADLHGLGRESAWPQAFWLRLVTIYFPCSFKLFVGLM